MTQIHQAPPFLAQTQPKGPFYTMARLPGAAGTAADTLPLGTIRTSDLKKTTDPLALASTLVDAYINKDAKYPEIGQMSLRMFIVNSQLPI